MKNRDKPKRRTTVRVCADGVKRGGFAKRTLQEDIAAFHAGVKKGAPDECWPWQGATLLMGNKSGGKYGTMTFLGKPRRTHRVAYMIAHNLEPIPLGKVIRHTPCNFGLCCNSAHLKLGTQKENVEDSVRDGLLATGDRSGARTHPERRPRGKNHPHAKLTDNDIVEIFKLRSEGVTEKVIAEKFKITDVSAILNRSSWPHVKIPSEYQFDKIAAKKLHRKNNGLAHRKVTDEQIRQARKFFECDGMKPAHIAKLFRWSASLAWNIVHRKKYAEIPDAPQIYQRIAPRVNVLRGYFGNEPYGRSYSAPVTSGVTILSGQLISLVSGAWVLGVAAGSEPFIAFEDSTDTDVVSSGLLLGLSCAGQYEIETAWFDNSVMMDQVLLNLVVNARDAMPNGGQLVIETSGVEFDEFAASQSAQVRVGSFVRLSVSDSGCGIPPEILPKIFEPFFTTKDVGKGTGLGLATVFGIVQQHQGWINVYSEVNHGTTFRIYLPRLAKNGNRKPAQLALAEMRGGNETILLVEDDPSLRVSVRKALSQLGYRILEAPTGVKALEVWKQNSDEIRLLLTDLVMPDGMTGKDLAQRILQKNPKLKVIFMSGYSVEVVGKDFPLKEGVNFLTKPFQASKLAQTIREALDSKI